MPDRRIASPTSRSFRYAAAVSMWRYPTWSADATALTVSAGGVWKTPKPSPGIVTPLLSSSVSFTRSTLDRIARVREALPVHGSPVPDS